MATGIKTAETYGFTLLEMMLVLLLLSLGAMMVVANWPGAQYRAGQEGQRLAERLNGLNRQAALSGNAYGLRVGADRWQLKVWRAQGWQDLTLPGAGAGQTLPDGWRLRLIAPGAEAAGNAPQVLLLPGGEITPFRLRYVYNDRLMAEIAPDEDGVIHATDGQDETP
ncbi:type II secretion system minor pseudopilin GspH [Enterobacillus tribolii]|uniref:type II secretion system minor pseudopilin GspH n=1 Tax=Enterobacillus tribolii TaxID=1487935 RepID=UPI0013C2F1F4|nr:type II secretion system minor pseudopilin GspH [Enterobacillus tribolii]